MANEILARQAQAHAKHTGEAFEDALESVLKTEAGGQLRELRDGPNHSTKASQWHEDLARGRRRERVQAAWEQFMLLEAEPAGVEIAQGKTDRLTPQTTGRDE